MSVAPRPVRHFVAPVATLLFAAFAVGCATIRRTPVTVAALQQDAVRIESAQSALRDTVIERLVRRAVRRGDRTIDVLMLSGGGQNGSFGVGFLRGWKQRATEPMPEFDLVTGVSTGALQAPYALLGTRAALDTITALYARAASSFAPSLDWWFWLRRTGGLVNTKRFDETVARSFEGPVRADLNTAFASDRQLLFTTTDFDLGIGRVWSMGDELDTGRTGADRVRTLIKGATAIPAIFPPVMVDGHLHADGGVIENVLTLFSFDDYARLGQRLQARGLSDVTVRVWVVMNLWTHAEPRALSPSSRRQISSRSTALLFYAHQPGTLSALENLSRLVSDRVPGLRMQLRVASLPAEEVLSPGASALFARPFMQRLDSIGFAKAQGATPWDAAMPTAFARPRTPPPLR